MENNEEEEKKIKRETRKREETGKQNRTHQVKREAMRSRK